MLSALLEIEAFRMASRWKLLSILIVLVWLFGAWQQQGRALAFTGGHCNGIELREYTPPLRGMLVVHAPPYEMHKLPFGQPDLEIQPLGLTHLWTSSAKVGFYLDGPRERLEARGWIAESRLLAVNRKGKRQGVLRTRTQRVGRNTKLSAIDLGFKVGGDPRFYRVDLYVRSLSGNQLAAYQDYFRIMKRKVNVRLGLDRDFYRAGDDVLMRLENYGTVSIGTGLTFVLEVFEGAQWEISPAAPPFFPSIGFGMSPGWALPCQRFSLPLDLALGRYRLVKPYGAPWGARTEHLARAVFDVIP